MLSLKQHIHQQCLQVLADKVDRIQKYVAELQAANSEDTKSSAGDKFETSREMNKREIDKNNLLLRQLNQMKVLLRKCEPGKNQEEIVLGSLVKSNENLYYFSVPLGKIEFEGNSCFVLSLASPLGKALLGKKAGESISFMNREIEILEVI